MNDDEEQVKELFNLSISDIVQTMVETGEHEFGMDVEFLDSKLSVRITFIEGMIN